MTTHAEELGMFNKKNAYILKLQRSFNCLVDLAADNIESIWTKNGVCRPDDLTSRVLCLVGVHYKCLAFLQTQFDLVSAEIQHAGAKLQHRFDSACEHCRRSRYVFFVKCVALN